MVRLKMKIKNIGDKSDDKEGCHQNVNESIYIPIRPWYISN